MADSIKQLNCRKPAHVLDIFLFIDLIDPLCQQCTDKIVQLVHELDQKTYCHIVPYQTLKSVDNFLKRNHLPINDLCLRNDIYKTSYLISLAYKAANFQGKKKARVFLQNLISFSDKLSTGDIMTYITQSAKLADIDVAMLQEDMYSKPVRELYKKDQKMAHQFSISSTPSLIIFDSCQSNGVLLDVNTISLDAIEDIILGRYLIEAVR